MKALNRIRKEEKVTKAAVRLTHRMMDRGNIVNTFKAVSLAYAIILHRNRGFGKERFEADFKDVCKLIDGYIGRYDPESLMTVLRIRAKEEVGVEIEWG